VGREGEGEGRRKEKKGGRRRRRRRKEEEKGGGRKKGEDSRSPFTSLGRCPGLSAEMKVKP
jgi:hypothetical protein